MVRISVKVQPRVSKEEVIRHSNGSLKIYLRAAPVGGKANKALIKILADYYKTKKSNVHIISGESSRNKIIEIGGR